MSKAKERAYEEYPNIPLPNLGKDFVAKQGHLREAYIRGYGQAEKDLALTWEDMHKIVDLWFEVATNYTIPQVANANATKSISSTELDKFHCEEVLRRFNQKK